MFIAIPHLGVATVMTLIVVGRPLWPAWHAAAYQITSVRLLGAAAGTAMVRV